MERHRKIYVSAALAVVLSGVRALAVTSAGSGHWTNGATWGGSVPGVGADAVIAAGHSVTVDVSTAALNTFTNNGTLTFLGTNTVLKAVEVTVNGTVTHVPNTATATNAAGEWVPDSRVWIVCTNLTVGETGKINVDAKGYAGSPSGSGVNGYGPGGGLYASSGTGVRGGGGYGGIGGIATTTRGRAYGTASAPEQPGSGGGGHGGGKGGAGGGAILIQADTIALNGSITANGETTTFYTGGGSGGAIALLCSRFMALNGVLRADGGSTSHGDGTGGGGRIALVYSPAAQAGVSPHPDFLFSAAPGLVGVRGRPGSVYLPDTQLLPNVLTNYHQLMGFTAWQPDSLTVAGGMTVFTEPVALTVTNKFEVSAGATLEVSGTNAPIRAREVLIGGTLTHQPQSATATNAAGEWVPDNRVWIECSNLTVAATGTINVNEKGYAGSASSSGLPGYGPGGGHFVAGGVGRGGGGYGGIGGYATATRSRTYGVAAAPDQPGSGGGGCTGGNGGAGGGAMVIRATNILVNGVLTANGAGTTYYSGGGSGGSIYLSCALLFSTGGVLRADGGNGDRNEGTGGGGRIAVAYDAAAQAAVSPKPDFAFSAAPGLVGTRGRPGTVYFPDIQLLPNTLTNYHQLVGWTNLAKSDLTIGGGLTVLPELLALTVSNNLAINGDGALEFYGSALTVGGSLTLSGLGDLWVYTQPTTSLAQAYGTLVDVGGAMTAASGSWIRAYGQPTNGAVPFFQVGSLTVSSGAWFSAKSGGYAGGTASADGPGPAPGKRGGGSGNWGGGGGHGGIGAEGADGGLGGQPVYGVSNAPVTPGSGGGQRDSGAGGGVIWVETEGTIHVDGGVTADGGDAASSWVGGGGAGGSVYFKCRRFAGGGAVIARGGNGGPMYGARSSTGGGGGGGGRVAVWRSYHDWTGSLAAPGSVTNGLYGWGGQPGAPGTVFWGVTPIPQGTVIVVR